MRAPSHALCLVGLIVALSSCAHQTSKGTVPILKPSNGSTWEYCGQGEMYVFAADGHPPIFKPDAGPFFWFDGNMVAQAETQYSEGREVFIAPGLKSGIGRFKYEFRGDVLKLECDQDEIVYRQVRDTAEITSWKAKLCDGRIRISTSALRWSPWFTARLPNSDEIVYAEYSPAPRQQTLLGRDGKLHTTLLEKYFRQILRLFRGRPGHLKLIQTVDEPFAKRFKLSELTTYIDLPDGSMLFVKDSDDDDGDPLHHLSALLSPTGAGSPVDLKIIASGSQALSAAEFMPDDYAKGFALNPCADRH